MQQSTMMLLGLRLALVPYGIGCWQKSAGLMTQRHAHSFASLGVNQTLVDVLSAQKIVEPTPIQSKVIPRLLSGVNCGIQSCTGSGKTLAYLLPLLTQIPCKRSIAGKVIKGPVGVVTASSRELCMQIVKTATNLLSQSPQFHVQQLIGGANPRRQHNALRSDKPVLVVGTPGRMLSMIQNKSMDVSQSAFWVLDEVDRLASKEDRHVTERLAKLIGDRRPEGRQTVLVSASLGAQQLDSLKEWCPNAEYISTSQVTSESVADSSMPEGVTSSSEATTDPSQLAISSQAEGAIGSAADLKGTDLHTVATRAQLILPPGLTHYFMMCSQSQSVRRLHSCILALGVRKALVFAGSQANAMHVMQQLQQLGLEVTVLHSSLSKLERTNIVDAFNRGVFRAMVVTDLVSRGMDFPKLDAVFNMGLPEDEIDYAHRAGRTNRLGGVEGVTVSIITAHEFPHMQRISRRLGVEFKRAAVAYGKFKTGSSTDMIIGI